MLCGKYECMQFENASCVVFMEIIKRVLEWRRVVNFLVGVRLKKECDVAKPV